MCYAPKPPDCMYQSLYQHNIPSFQSLDALGNQEFGENSHRSLFVPKHILSKLDTQRCAKPLITRCNCSSFVCTVEQMYICHKGWGAFTDAWKKKHKWLIHDWQSQIHYGNIHWLLPNKDLNLIPFEENRVRLEQPPWGKLWQHQVGSVNCLHGHQGKKQLSCRPKRSFLYQQTGLLTSTIQDVQVYIPWLFVHCNHDQDETKPKTR